MKPKKQRLKKLKTKMPKKSNSGVALLMVLGTLTLVAAVVSDFQFNSRVDLQLAFNARDALQAEYNALTALRLRALILRHARKLNQATQALGPALGMDAGMMPPLGQILDMIPVDCGLISAVFRQSTDSVFDDEDDAEAQSDMLFGDCNAVSESEHTKISINVLAKRTGSGGVSADKQVTALLVGLLANPAFERHFQEDDRNGTHAENPLELVGAIADWIDRDKNQTVSLMADEDRYYDFLSDSYSVKNAPFDSLAELQMVHGVDDELFDILKNNVSIYTDGTQIELGNAPLQRVEWGLWSCVREGMSLLELLTHPGYRELLRQLQEMRLLGAGTFGILKVQGLVGLVRANGLDLVMDPAAVQQRFTDQQGSTWYTIEAQGRVGNASRRIRAVFQVEEGQMYYARVE